MGSSALLRTAAIAAALACGAGAVAAAQRGLYASLLVAMGAGVWLALAPLLQMPLPRARNPATVPGTREDLVMARVLLDSSPTPLVALDDDGNARVLNRAARRLFVTDERIAPATTALLAATTARMLSYDGHHYRLDRAEVRRAGPARTILALADVEAVERTAAARATRDLLQVLSHEVMNALAPITSLADSARAAAADDAPPLAELRAMLGTLARRAEGLQRFTEAYREMARLPPPAPEPVALVDIIDDLARQFAGRWDGRVTLDAVAPPVDPVAIDRDQIGQALWALLQNGAEAALGGASAGNLPGVTLTTTQANARVVFTVADTGPGMPSGDRLRIFDAFFTTKPAGSGVGLSLARQIARAHGGDLTLTDTARTSFVLTLPL